MFRTIVAAAALAALAGTAAGAATITNTPAWNGSDYIYYFGAPDTTNYGQTFTAPGGPLRSVTFNLLSGDPGDFRLMVSGWDGNGVTGTPLYTSGDLAYTAGAVSAIGINVATVAGAQYIAFLTTAGVASPTGNVEVGGTLDDTIAGGAFRFLNSDGVAPAVGQTWDDWNVPDLAFTAVFGVVPEPQGWALLIAGFGIVGAAARRQRRMVAA